MKLPPGASLELVDGAVEAARDANTIGIANSNRACAIIENLVTKICMRQTTVAQISPITGENQIGCPGDHDSTTFIEFFPFLFLAKKNEKELKQTNTTPTRVTERVLGPTVRLMTAFEGSLGS